MSVCMYVCLYKCTNLICMYVCMYSNRILMYVCTVCLYVCDICIHVLLGEGRPDLVVSDDGFNVGFDGRQEEVMYVLLRAIHLVVIAAIHHIQKGMGSRHHNELPTHTLHTYIYIYSSRFNYQKQTYKYI